MRPWRDGWRHLRFMLLYSPGWLFLAPGGAMFAIGLVGSIALIRGPVHVGSTVLDIHTLLVTAFMTILGYQVIVFAVSTRTFATEAGLLPASRILTRLYRYVRLETGLLAGGLATLLGLAGLVLAFANWSHVGFERLDPDVTMRQLIPAVVLVALGVQTVFASFFLSMMGMSHTGQVHLKETPAEPPD